jgi:polyisoprenoid-binding protein YceI
MTKHLVKNITALASLSAIFAFAAINETNSTPIDVAGSAAFIANTNVSAITVKAKSQALQANTTVTQTQEGLQLGHIEAWVPVGTLTTGMGVRDEHMRKLIFTGADGKTPDLRFEAEKTACPALGSNHTTTCQVSGTLSIRGIARPFAVALKVREQAQSFKVASDGIVKLSDYGIVPPSEFGVKTQNDVQLHLEFTGKETPGTIASNKRVGL